MIDFELQMSRFFTVKTAAVSGTWGGVFMRNVWRSVFLGLLISATTCGSVWAQATAQISGTVRDQTGAVLPGVEVTATQTETGIARSTISNETGSFVLPNLL